MYMLYRQVSISIICIHIIYIRTILYYLLSDLIQCYIPLSIALLVDIKGNCFTKRYNILVKYFIYHKRKILFIQLVIMKVFELFLLRFLSFCILLHFRYSSLTSKGFLSQLMTILSFYKCIHIHNVTPTLYLLSLI